ncbi:glycine--tRNA ligase [Halobacteriales archaeon QS_8_69_26]|nr:MAG: glycine--tRNA ligase [Halobacteriales archaeon QS_8_69_26]
MTEDATEKLVELAKRRGFFFPTAGSYGGVAGFYTFGPEGASVKSNVEEAWRRRFTTQEGHAEIDAPTVMPEPVFEASGHLETFDDMLVECAECGASHRADHVVEDDTDIEEAESIPIPEVEEIIREHDLRCPTCGTPLADRPVEEFNLMFETTIGPGTGRPGYLRPETAQGIFVEFPRLSEYARNQLPFGVTQIGRAYRNEISPRKSIIRVREFTQAELELFYDPEEDDPDLSGVRDRTVRLYPVAEQEREDGTPYETTVGEAVDEGTIASPWIAYYLGIAAEWYESLGVDVDRFRYRQHLAGERAHYASDCWDAETELGGDWVELAGFATRGNYDLSKHDEHSEDRYTVFKQYDEPRTVERATVDPDMSYLGPEYGGRAGAIADALEDLAERDRSAFEGDSVTVEVDGETHEIPVEHTGFAVEEVTETGEHVVPHVVEPSFGVGRLVYTLLEHAYREDVVDGEERTYLELEPAVAPTFAGVFPLTDEAGLPDLAREVAADLRAAGLSVTYDDSGNIGRRYRRQDEVGTPFCVTVDHDSLEDGAATVRDRDTTEQVRVPIEDLPGALAALRDGEATFDELAADPQAFG